MNAYIELNKEEFFLEAYPILRIYFNTITTTVLVVIVVAEKKTCSFKRRLIS